MASRIRYCSNIIKRAASRRPTGLRFLSSSGDSITYSGGQAHRGQGGYYGSGGARAVRGSGQEHVPTNEETRSKMLALAHDVTTIRTVMDQVESLEAELEAVGDPLSSKAMELKTSLKKTLTDTQFEQSLNNLEISGSPVWGLSTDEREMITLAREKRNEC